MKSIKLYKKHTKKFVAAALCAVMAMSAAACGNQNPQSSTVPVTVEETDEVKFDKLCDDMFIETMEADALNAHFTISNPADYGIKFTEEDYILGNISLESFDEDMQSMQEDLKRLTQIDRNKLTDQQKLTYDTLMAYIDIQQGFSESTMLQNIFAPSTGIASNFSTIFTEFQLCDKEDAEQYLLFLKDTKRYMNQALEMAKEQSKQGYFMSDKIADKAIEECMKHYESNGEDIIEVYSKKLDALKLSEGEKNELLKTQKEYIDKYYLPAFKDAADVLTSLKGTGKNDGGLCGYGAAGNNYYKAIVKMKTSSNMTPTETIELLENEMKALFVDVLTLSAAYAEYESFTPDFKTSKEIVEFLINNIGSGFPAPATTDYNIEYMSKTSENDALSAYYVLSRIDNISVNNIKVNSSAINDDVMTLYTTLAHEAYPGHLYQLTGFYANENIHNVRKILDFIGATEGWAQYASGRAVDYLDTSSNVKNLIRANSLLGYIIMARVDLGVNYEGWSLDDVYDYVSPYYPTASKDYDDKDNPVSELYYMAVGNPGEVIPYAVGHIKMNELREQAEEALGNKFDETDYHKFISEVGIATFEIYESELEKWIERH